MKKNLLFLLIVCLILLGITVATIFFTRYVVFDIKFIPMDVRVSDHPGFNLDTDLLHFGGTTSPGSVYRKIEIHNQYTRPLRVTVQPYGDIGKWVSAEDYEQIFQPDEKRNITMRINVPSGVQYGDYNGTLKVLFTRVLI